MIRFLLSFLLLTSVLGAASITPIEDGKLINALSGNGQNINNLGALVFGSGTGTGAIHILPNGSPTLITQGIRIGTDVAWYRSGANTSTVVGNLIVTGSITGSGSPVTLAGTNTWTGANTFNSSVTFGSTVTIGTLGLSFSGSGAAVTRTNLGVRPNFEVQAYSVLLKDIAALTPTDGLIIVGNGTTFVGRTGSTARSSLGLGTGDSPQFTGLTLTGSGTIATLSVTTSLSAPNALGLLSAVGIGGTTLYGDGTKLFIPGLDVTGAASFGGTTTFTGTVNFGNDVNLYRSAADVLKTDDTISAASLLLGSPLGPAYGGLGISTAATAADRMPYTTSTGSWGVTAVTAQARTFLAQTTAALQRTALGLGTGALVDVPSSGDASTLQLVLGSDTRLTNSRAPSGAAGGSLAGSYPNPTIGASGVTAATYGSSTTVPVITIGADGRVTSASSTTLAGAAPTGTAGGDLAGSYPNPTIAVNSVTMGTDTAGDYVANLTAGTGISITSGTGESSTPTISTAQDITTAGNPTFAGLTTSGNAAVGGNLTVTGALSLSSLTLSTLTLSTPALTGLVTSKTIHVDPGHSAATDTRTGIGLYDPNRPFATLSAAYTAASSGEVVYLHKNATAYPTVALKDGADIYLESGAYLSGVALATGGTAAVYGSGALLSTSGTAVTVSNAGAILHIHTQVYCEVSGCSITNGSLYLYRTVTSTGSGSAALAVTGGTVYLMDGLSLLNTGSGASISGSGGTVIAEAPVGCNASIASAVLSGLGSGTYFSQGLMTTGTAVLRNATSEGSKLQLGTSAGFYESATDHITTLDTLHAGALLLTAPLPISSGGTGAANATDAFTNLGIPFRGVVKTNTITLNNSNSSRVMGTDTSPDAELINVNATDQNAFILYMPNTSGAGLMEGRRYVVRNTGTKWFYLSATSYKFNNLSGHDTFNIGPGSVFSFTYDGANASWWVGDLRMGRTFSGVYTASIAIGSHSNTEASGDTQILVGNSTGGSFSVYLPDNDMRYDGMTITVRNAGTANAITLDRNSQNINGAASNVTLTGNATSASRGWCTVVWSESNSSWYVVSYGGTTTIP